MWISNVVKSQKGATMIIIALFITIILGMAALVIDIGLIVFQKHKLQNALDAAALAASQDLPNSTNAQNIANNYIELNGFKAVDISVTFADSNRIINVQGTKKINYFL